MLITDTAGTGSAPDDPRWGSDERDAKADAIWLTMLDRCGARISDGTWLDIGCGSGGIAVALAPKVRRMIGIDPEPWQRWHDFESAHANLSFHKYDGDCRPPAALDGSIDVVVCNQVYEHVADPRALLADIARVLKPDGRCYFAGPNLLWPIEPHVFWPFVHWLPRRVAVRLMDLLGSKRSAELDARSTHYWRLTRWFGDAGLDYTIAISSRIRAGLESRGVRWHRQVRWVDSALDAMAPFSPGFVFVLCKLAPAARN